MAVLHFECTACNGHFDCDVGAVSFRFSIFRRNNRPTFENDIVCPDCGIRTMDEVLLTELGQTQLTELFMRP